MKIGLCMIVKNEAHIIHESMTCTLPLIDTYCIVDTGSTDDTIKKIKDFYNEKGISGKVHERPWKNFGHNRSESLKLCDGEMDYILVIDADDLMTFPSNGREIIEDVLKKNPNCVNINIHQNDMSYYRSQIFKANDNWGYVGVLHEYPSNHKANNSILTLPLNFFMDSRRLGARNLTGDKMKRDIATLLEGLKDEPENERYIFYLAQSYRDDHNFPEAIRWYKKRFSIGKWVEEAWFSAYSVGEIYKVIGNIPKFEYWMQKAFAFFPKRAETLYKLAEYYRLNGEFYKSYHYIQLGSKIDYPHDNVLFVEKFPYTGGFLYEKSIVEFYIHPERVLQTTIEYLLRNHKYKENCVSNLKFSVKQISSVASFINIPSIFGEDFRPSALSVLDFPYANVRFVNYLSPVDGEYKTKDGSPIQTKNAYFNFETREIFPMLEEDTPKNKSLTQGLEDLRLYKKDGKLNFTATSYYEYKKDYISIVHGEYDIENKLLKNCLAIESPTNSNTEKNWLHVPGTSDFIYGWFPLKIGNIEGSTFHVTREIQTPPLFSTFRGSCQPMEWNGKWLILVHLVEYVKLRKYYHCFVELDKDYSLSRISLPFIFKQSGVEYCLSCRMPQQNIIECFVSITDSDLHSVRFTTDQLKWIIVKTTENNIVRVPENVGVYWAGYLSACYPGGSIEQYVNGSILRNDTKTSAIFSQCDGIFAQKEYDEMKANTNETRIVVTSASEFEKLLTKKKPNTVPIFCTIATRNFDHPNILLTPLDDQTFSTGIDSVLPKKRPSWTNKKSIAFWRGNPGGYERPSIRVNMVENLFEYPNTDVFFAFQGDMGSYGDSIHKKYKKERCDIQKHLEYKYIVIIDGICIASSHQWVFGSGSVPIMITHPDNNFWFKKFLKPMENYVPIKYDLSDLKEKIDWLVANDDKALKIAINSFMLSKQIFNPSFQRKYIDESIKKILTS
jgi:hypothetical protein